MFEIYLKVRNSSHFWTTNNSQTRTTLVDAGKVLMKFVKNRWKTFFEMQTSHSCSVTLEFDWINHVKK